MSQGYHSRSPEEFRKYLQEISFKTKKRFRVQLIILADLVILVLLFIYVSDHIKTANGGSSLQKTGKITLNAHSVYFSRGEDFQPEFSQYFLFIHNDAPHKNTFYLPGGTLTYRLEAGDKTVCARFTVNTGKKEIEAGSTEFLPIAIPKSILNGAPSECDSIFKKGISRGSGNFLKIFSGEKDNKADSIFTINDGQKNIELVIKNDLWVK